MTSKFSPAAMSKLWRALVPRRKLGEDTLLQVAARMDAARPWAHQRPPE